MSLVSSVRVLSICFDFVGYFYATVSIFWNSEMLCSQKKQVSYYTPPPHDGNLSVAATSICSQKVAVVERFDCMVKNRERQIYTRWGGLMVVTELCPRPNGLGTSPGQAIMCSVSQILSLLRAIGWRVGTSEQWRLIMKEGVEILLVASCYRNRRSAYITRAITRKLESGRLYH